MARSVPWTVPRVTTTCPPCVTWDLRQSSLPPRHLRRATRAKTMSKNKPKSRILESFSDRMINAEHPPKPSQQTARILGPPELVGDVPRVGTGSVHWSACPSCGVSRRSVDQPAPVIKQTVPGGRDSRGVLCYMRCRACGTEFKTVRPD